MSSVVKVTLKKAQEAVSALNSINKGKSHEIRVAADSEPVFWQRQEWIEWAAQAGRDLADDLKCLNGELSQQPVPAVEMLYLPSDALELLLIWQTHLGSCREACDDSGKQLWDRIAAVTDKVQVRCNDVRSTV